MAKKSKGDAKKQGVTLQKTSKFAVIDAPGVEQPALESENVQDSKTNHTSKDNKDGQQGRRATASSGPRMGNQKGEVELIGKDCFTKRTSKPDWLKDRLSAYESISKLRSTELQSKKPVPIAVTLPDGNVLKQSKDGTPYEAWVTTPYDVAVTISQGLADKTAVCRVTYSDFVSDYNLAEDGMDGDDYLMEAMDTTTNIESSQKSYLWDLTRPLVGNVSKLELLKFDDDPDAQTVFWHSSAHMLGEAMEHLWGARLTIGPPLKGGFYYDCYMGNEDVLREEDCK